MRWRRLIHNLGSRYYEASLHCTGWVTGSRAISDPSLSPYALIIAVVEADRLASPKMSNFAQTRTGIRSKLFELRHRDAGVLVMTIIPLDLQRRFSV
jgi:hypothetical protein